MGNENDRPEMVKNEHLEYLDELRESGRTNMWGASSWLEQEFCLTGWEATKVLMYWMKSFGKERR